MLLAVVKRRQLRSSFYQFLLIQIACVGVAFQVSYARRPLPYLFQSADEQEDSKDNDSVKQPLDMLTDVADSLFDITSDWKIGENNNNASSTTFWSKILVDAPRDIISNIADDSDNQNQDDADAEDDDEDASWSTSFQGLATSFLVLLGTGGQEDTIPEIVEKAREKMDHQDDDSGSIAEILELLDTHVGKVGEVVEEFMGAIESFKMSPSALLYYLEYEDERKNPSFKRRAHRFCPSVNMNKIEELNHVLQLARLCYADTLEELREGLSMTTYEPVFVNLTSSPGAPANFIAVKREQSFLSNKLEVLMGVRGTKTFADAITDLICVCEDYRGGKAHSYILNSGKYLVGRHRELLEELRKESGKSSIDLTIVGHSLGAGAASIAGIEFNDLDNFHARVVGFGTPALLSEELAASCSFVTTIVNDADIVPRASGIAVANLMLDLMEFNWLPYADRDIQHALHELQKRQPSIFAKDTADKVMSVVTPLLERHLNSTIKKERTERIMPELYPPGKCFHIYNDGHRLSFSRVPNRFFSEIDFNRRMLDDHLFVAGYEPTFVALMRQHTGDYNFRFEDS